MVGRRNGLIALEEHVMDPKNSAIFQRYAPVLHDPVRLEFLCNGLKPVIDGKIQPDQIEELLEAELDAKSSEAEHPVHMLQLVGDSLPGIGIVAAVLGIINTMASISAGPEKVGESVAAADGKPRHPVTEARRIIRALLEDDAALRHARRKQVRRDRDRQSDHDGYRQDQGMLDCWPA